LPSWESWTAWRVATEHVEHLAPVVVAGWHLGVGVVVGFAARPFEALHFVTLGVMNEAEVRVSVAPRLVVGQLASIEASLDPVLEVILLVLGGDPLDQIAVCPRTLALKEHLLNCAHCKPSVADRTPRRLGVAGCLQGYRELHFPAVSGAGGTALK